MQVRTIKNDYLKLDNIIIVKTSSVDFREKQQFQEHHEGIAEHIEKYFNEEDTSVFHEIPTLDIHLDVYHIKPKKLEFELLITSGMSSIAMNVDEIPEDSDAYKFAELIVMIPKGITFGKVYPSDNEFDWIISMIKQVAKFPHFYNTWIGIGHTIQATNDLKPYSDKTEYCGCIVLPHLTFKDDFKQINTPNGVINLYQLFPLYKEELEFKIENGYNAFIQFLIKNDTSEIIDVNRVNFCE